jgi:prepilin-type N-terminal cleavage/methylation domain-containing protein
MNEMNEILKTGRPFAAKRRHPILEPAARCLKPAASRHGFTLLELLISLAMLLAVILVVTGAFRAGNRAVETGGSRIEALERARTSVHILDAQVQSFLPMTFDTPQGRRHYFAGDAETLRLATSFSALGHRGPVVASYRAEAGPDGRRRLILAEHSPGMENSREALLLEGFEALRIAYFTKDINGETLWLDRWEDDKGAPAKIRLRVESRGREFDLVIPARAGGAA